MNEECKEKIILFLTQGFTKQEIVERLLKSGLDVGMDVIESIRHMYKLDPAVIVPEAIENKIRKMHWAGRDVAEIQKIILEEDGTLLLRDKIAGLVEGLGGPRVSGSVPIIARIVPAATKLISVKSVPAKIEPPPVKQSEIEFRHKNSAWSVEDFKRIAEKDNRASFILKHMRTYSGLQLTRDQLSQISRDHSIKINDDIGRQSHDESIAQGLYHKGLRNNELIHAYDRITGKFMTVGALATMVERWRLERPAKLKHVRPVDPPKEDPTCYMSPLESKVFLAPAEIKPALPEVITVPGLMEAAVTFVSKSAPKKVEPVPEIPVQSTAQIVAATQNIPSLDTQNIQTIPAAALAAQVPKVDEAPYDWIEKEPVEKVLEPIKPGILDIDIPRKDLDDPEKRNPPREAYQIRCVKFDGKVQYYLPPTGTKRGYRTRLIARMLQKMPFNQVLLAYYKQTGQPLGPSALGEVIQSYNLPMCGEAVGPGFLERLWQAGINVVTSPFKVLEAIMHLLESPQENKSDIIEDKK